MHAQSPRPLSDRPSLITWLATNTSGVPRAQARRVVALGLILGLILGLLAGLLAGTPFEPRAFGVAGGVLGGATLGALGAVLAARLLDWAARWSDPLLGFSGAVRCCSTLASSRCSVRLAVESVEASAGRSVAS